MPLYEYHCRRCAAKFELLRPMSRADEPATCPNGHGAATRTLSVFARVGRDAVPEFDASPSSGGCACGGGGCGGH
ncbi:MAG: zinc ribbon domain-containing protein [Dehalococcoidia bacterium]|nr:MAG: zinc ribbon domain-containing protein [Dehalococcoidia bacterium]